MAVAPESGRLAKLAVIQDAFDQWEQRYVQTARFRPKRRSARSDYNQHYLDVEATEEQEAELQREVASKLTEAGF